MSEFEMRLHSLVRKLIASDLDALILCDPDNIYYFIGAENYIGMDFGRPTILLVQREGKAQLITPAGDLGMVQGMAHGVEIVGWRDSAQGEWRTILDNILRQGKFSKIGIEEQYNPLVHAALNQFSSAQLAFANNMVEEMRLIKSPQEIEDLRKAGLVGDAMMEAIRYTIGSGVSEYEVSLAAMAAGTRKAAALLTAEAANPLYTPMVSNLQIIKTGTNTDLGHCRPSLKCIAAGEPVAVCLCGMINYKHMKLAMDRPFYVGMITNEHERMTKIALESQMAALDSLKPGISVSEVHEAASSVLQKHGYGPCTRTGRGLGASYTEKPQIMLGDPTLLQAGMVLAIDGNLTIKDFGVQFGDSVVITNNGFEFLTNFPRDIQVL